MQSIDAAPRARCPAAVVRVLAMLLSRAVGWRERERGRRLLARLDDRMLRDVGLSRSEVEREAVKLFWQR